LVQSQPLLSELAKALGFFQPPFVPLLFDGRRAAFPDCSTGIAAFLARLEKRDSITTVFAEIDGLPMAIEPVIQTERDSAARHNAHIHAVPVCYL